MILEKIILTMILIAVAFKMGPLFGEKDPPDWFPVATVIATIYLAIQIMRVIWP